MNPTRIFAAMLVAVVLGLAGMRGQTPLSPASDPAVERRADGSIAVFDGRIIPALPTLLSVREQYELRVKWLEKKHAWTSRARTAEIPCGPRREPRGQRRTTTEWRGNLICASSPPARSTWRPTRCPRPPRPPPSISAVVQVPVDDEGREVEVC